jgi:tetratricopeptide (TPR) repeat protein
VEAKRGVNAAVLRHIASATATDPRNAALAYQHGTMLIQSVRQDMTKDQFLRTVDAAVAELTRASTLNPYSYSYQLALADALDAATKPDDAMKAIQRALELAPLYEEPRVALGMHYHRLRQFEQAESAYLWAGEAKAKNREGAMNWLESYRQLLSDTAALAERDRKTHNAQSR